MKTCFRKLSAAVAALAFVFGMASATPASAVVMYDYTGPNFQFFQGIYSGSDNVTATLTLDTPLSANLGDQTGNTGVLVDITSFSGFALTMNDGHQTLDSSTATFGSTPLAMVATDGLGQVTFWFIGLAADGSHEIASLHNWDGTRCLSNDSGRSGNTDDGFRIIAGSVGVPCTSGASLWTSQSQTAIPEPATFALVVAGLTGLAIGRRRRRPLTQNPCMS